MYYSIEKCSRKSINLQKIWQRIEIAIKKFRTGVPFRKAAEMAGLDYWDYQSELDKREVPVLSSLSLARARIKKHIKGQVSTPSEANLHGVNILHSSYQAGSTSHISIRSQADKQAGWFLQKKG